MAVNFRKKKFYNVNVLKFYFDLIVRTLEHWRTHTNLLVGTFKTLSFNSSQTCNCFRFAVVAVSKPLDKILRNFTSSRLVKFAARRPRSSPCFSRLRGLRCSTNSLVWNAFWTIDEPRGQWCLCNWESFCAPALVEYCNTVGLDLSLCWRIWCGLNNRESMWRHLWNNCVFNLMWHRCFSPVS